MAKCCPEAHPDLSYTAATLARKVASVEKKRFHRVIPLLVWLQQGVEKSFALRHRDTKFTSFLLCGFGTLCFVRASSMTHKLTHSPLAIATAVKSTKRRHPCLSQQSFLTLVTGDALKRTKFGGGHDDVVLKV